MARRKKKASQGEVKGRIIPLSGNTKDKKKKTLLRVARDQVNKARLMPGYRPGEGNNEGESFWPSGGNPTLFILAFSGLLLLLFYPPFFRGLFFPVEQRWTLLFATLLFCLAFLWKLSRREVSFLNRPLDYAAAALVVVYILAAIKPASQGLAVAEVAKVLLYFLTYWLVSRLGGQRRTLYLLHALYLAAAGAALLALLAATDLVYIKDGFVGGRFYSTLQYPNALASYVGAGSIIGFYLWGQAGNRQRYLYAVFNYLLLMVFLGTGSRGAFLVFPVVAGLFWLLASGYRLQILAHLLVSATAALAGNFYFIPLALAKAYGSAWSWFALGLLVALAGQILIHLAGWGLRTPRARLVAGLAVLFFILGGGFFFVQHQLAVTPAAGGNGQPAGLLLRILPPQIMARLEDISLETRSGRERLIWTGDALKMVRERPLLGFGGGGWEAAYRRYQSYFYNSTQVHNDYAQVAVETGLVGIAVLGSLWVLFLLACLGNYRSTQNAARLQALAIGMAALNLGLHAAIDFDLALGSVSMMLWSCFGLARNGENQRLAPETPLPPGAFKNRQFAYITGIGFATLIIALFSVSFLAGVTSARRAAAALQHNNLKATATYLAEASRYDPFTASYNSDLAGIYLREGKTKEALALALKASAKEPYNLTILNRLAEAYWHNGAVEQALITMERARELAPWAGGTWENLGQAYVTAGISYLRASQREKAREVFEKAATLPAEIKARVDSLGEFKNLHQPGGVALTPAIQLRAAIAQYFLGREKEAEAGFKAAAKDNNLKAEALLWQAILANHQGNTSQALQLLDQLQKADAGLVQQYEQLKCLPVLAR